MLEDGEWKPVFFICVIGKDWHHWYYICMKTFHILSAIPEVIEPYARASILGRAVKNKLIKIKSYNIRRWTMDKHRKIDDTPYGGGPGMVLKVEPIYKAVKALRVNIKKTRTSKRTRVILFSTRGKVFTQQEAIRLSKYDHLVFICGRYEGVDERVAKHIVNEEISVGNFVLSGGEVPAMLVVDAVARTIPGVLGKQESLEDIKGSYPVYTRPPVFVPEPKKYPKKQWKVPDELMKGNHKEIERWRQKRGNRG